MSNIFPSFSILNTAALIGLFSILIPLIIHLINRSKGNLVYLGNIDFVKQVKKIRVTEVKLTQWILLLLRVLIFTLITFLVAGLKQMSEVKVLDETQLYFSPDWIITQETSKFISILQQHPQVNSFVLATNYPEINQDNYVQLKQKLESQRIRLHSSALITEIANRQQQVKKIKVFSTNSSNEFPKDRPRQYQNIEWIVEPLATKIQKIPEVAVTIYSDENRLLETRVLQLSFEYLTSKGNQSFIVDYRSLGSVNGTAIESGQTGWIIWLSDKPVSEEIWERVKQGDYLLTDATTLESKGLKQSRNKITLTNANISGISSEFVGNHSAKGSNDLNDTLIWSDNLHSELLSSSVVGAGLHYRLNSRFNPWWNNLVENPKFPMILADLLNQPYRYLKANTLSASELNNLAKSSSKKLYAEDLYDWLILIIALLWVLERWLSEKRKAT
jgi:hypothetical protein